MTTTLHIEHRITDYPTWRSAFDRFADARRTAGVTAHRIRMDKADDRSVVIDLDFDTTEQAQAFADFLRRTVWASPENAPALVGAPETRLLVGVD